ncbi:hypothetical protein DL769_010873 [Monosporascus sp. CRB-8-3]|nr:hypothetical protein DL769_010873 [Monosporascus sp. CRB-8-3]
MKVLRTTHSVLGSHSKPYPEERPRTILSECEALHAQDGTRKASDRKLVPNELVRNDDYSRRNDGSYGGSGTYSSQSHNDVYGSSDRRDNHDSYSGGCGRGGNPRYGGQTSIGGFVDERRANSAYGGGHGGDCRGNDSYDSDRRRYDSGYGGNSSSNGNDRMADLDTPAVVMAMIAGMIITAMTAEGATLTPAMGRSSLYGDDRPGHSGAYGLVVTAETTPATAATLQHTPVTALETLADTVQVAVVTPITAMPPPKRTTTMTGIPVPEVFFGSLIGGGKDDHSHDSSHKNHDYNLSYKNDSHDQKSSSGGLLGSLLGGNSNGHQDSSKKQHETITDKVIQGVADYAKKKW